MIAATYIINLAASTDRWRDLQPTLDAMRLGDRIRYEAVDGRALEPGGIRARQRDGRLSSGLGGFDAKCLYGEIGCALSHAGVLADIVRRQWPTALILEDDIALGGVASTWPHRLAKAFADLPADWELWYLYRCFDIEHRTIRLSPRTIIPWTPQGGAAYAVTLAGAMKLLAAIEPVAGAVDRVYAALVQQRRIAAYAASPLLVVPGAHPSVINRDNPAKEWVENGINRPPEYWPEAYLAHLGEALPPDWPRRRPAPGIWQRIADRVARFGSAAA